MNYILGVGDRVWMVSAARKDFKRGSNQVTVANQPSRKSYKDKEGERNSQANLVHLSQTKPV